MNVALHSIQLEEEVDREWIELMRMAREMGITPDEIRSFFSKKSLILVDQS